MKKLLLLSSFLAFAVVSFAQNTIPRFGNTKNSDNTGRVATWRYYTPTDAAGADTLKLQPHSYTSIVQYSAVDSLAVQVTNLTNCYVGDEIEVLVTNSSGSGHQVKFVGTNWQFGSGGAAIALTSSKRANINFIFDGTYFVETSRLVQ